MDFVISRTALENGGDALFYQEKEAFSGVNKIAA